MASNLRSMLSLSVNKLVLNTRSRIAATVFVRRWLARALHWKRYRSHIGEHVNVHMYVQRKKTVDVQRKSPWSPNDQKFYLCIAFLVQLIFIKIQSCHRVKQIFPLSPPLCNIGRRSERVPTVYGDFANNWNSKKIKLCLIKSDSLYA